jgi:uncharacterized protein (DUF2249 family)
MVTTPTPTAQVDLRSPDFFVRRRRLLDALQDLAPGQELLVTTDGPDDLSWLWFEAEARTERAYRWIPDGGTAGSSRTAVRLP